MKNDLQCFKKMVSLKICIQQKIIILWKKVLPGTPPPRLAGVYYSWHTKHGIGSLAKQLLFQKPCTVYFYIDFSHRHID